MAFDMADYSVRFIRGRNFKDDNVTRGGRFDSRARVLATAQSKKGISHQVCPLTEAELDERRHGFPHFWTEPNFPGRSQYKDTACTALEVAAKTGNLEILISYERQERRSLPGCNHQSQIIIMILIIIMMLINSRFKARILRSLFWRHPLPSTKPAIAAGQQSMLRHLLSTCGYSPNYRPRAAPTAALPPLSYAIARCDLNNTGVQRCLVDLLSHPQLDANLRTPIFNVHPLHFATARHDTDLLSWLAGFIPGGFGAAWVTALGHTLLHVASLPLTTSQTVARNPDVAKSIHCARTLDSPWTPFRFPISIHMQFMTPTRQPQPLTVAQQQAQKATIRVLLEWGGIDVRAKDVDGNTALHYSASTLNVDEETVELVRHMEGGEAVWQEAMNYWGLTPRQLWGE